MTFRERVGALPADGRRGEVRVDRDGDVAIITIDHPSARNAMSPGMMVQLADGVGALAGASGPLTGVRAVVMVGAGGTFCAGGDLAAVQDHLLQPGIAREMQAFMARACDALAGLPMLVVAAVEGAALGGGAELLSACDVVFAHPSARIGWVQAAMGVSPGFGGARRLVGRVGRSRAVDILTHARPLSAAEALNLGIVDGIAEDPLGRALERAREAASLPAVAGTAVKPLVDAILAGDGGAEAATFERVWGGPEHVAALDRFRRR